MDGQEEDGAEGEEVEGDEHFCVGLGVGGIVRNVSTILSLR